jgi:hypothetical protein
LPYRQAYGNLFPAAQEYVPPLRFPPGIFSVVSFSSEKIFLSYSGKFGQVENKTEHLIRANAFKNFCF